MHMPPITRRGGNVCVHTTNNLRRVSSTPDLSASPQRGSAYLRPTGSSNNDNKFVWHRSHEPGGRRLWIQLVVAFTLLALLGVLFIALGAVHVKSAFKIHMEERRSLPMTWCVLGLVGGTIMLVGSVVLGKFLISKKWRTNQLPNYRNRAPTRVRYFTVHSRDRSGSARVELEMPPPYDNSVSPTLFVISDGDISFQVPPPGGRPPSYSDVTDVPVLPPVYSPQDPLSANEASAEATSTIPQREAETPRSARNPDNGEAVSTTRLTVREALSSAQ